MKLKITLALFLILLSIALHAYLTSHYYPLRFGLGAENSVCNVGEAFNCDAVAASSYSSFVGVPLSVWGLATHIILLVMVLIFWLGLSERSSDWKRWTFYVAVFSSLASLVMAAISFTQLNTYCLFCIILYFLSFAIAALMYVVQDENPLSKIFSDLKGIIGSAKGLTLSFIAIPIVASLTHASILKNYEAGELDAIARSFIQEWKTSPKVNFTASPAFSFGAPEAEAKLVIAEFADFRCGHCKEAAPSLHAFAKSHLNEVHFKFYTFPLDGQCNPEIPSGDGVSCRISKAVVCADKQDKALALHDQIFENQRQFQQLPTPAAVDNELKTHSAKLAINFESLLSCMNEASTQDHIAAQIQQAKLGGLRGTPTVFANSRKLERGQLIPVLEMALKQASEVRP